MKINNAIIGILRRLHAAGNAEIRNSLKISENGCAIYSNGRLLVDINADSISLFGHHELLQKINAEGETQNTLNPEKMHAFLHGIIPHVIRLNHVGISYVCEASEAEIKAYGKMLEQGFKMFEEESDDEHYRWFFIGDRSDSPMLEIVLNSMQNGWTPHFHIDIDTTLDAEDLDNRLKCIFGSGFEWSLDTPKGTVLGMKILGSIDGTKICLGLGTARREAQMLREYDLCGK